MESFIDKLPVKTHFGPEENEDNHMLTSKYENDTKQIIKRELSNQIKTKKDRKDHDQAKNMMLEYQTLSAVT